MIRSFLSSNKKHLFITGKKQSGKSTLLKELLNELDVPGIITSACPKDKVIFTSSLDNHEITIGKYNPLVQRSTNKMEIDYNGIFQATVALQNLCSSDSEYVYVDEIGYLEKDCPEYLDALNTLLNSKRCIFVLRKENLEHLNNLKHRDDCFIFDLDQPFSDVGCVIMASGYSRRFGDFKLLTEYKNKPLIEHILDKTEMFDKRVVVTRYKEIESLCEEKGIACILHDLPYKSDTIALGTRYFEKNTEALLFVTADQPELTEETLLAYAISAQNNSSILRLKYQDNVSSPGLFPKQYYDELMHLPEDCGGNVLIKKYGCAYIKTDNPKEVIDIDTKEDLAIIQK